MRTLHTIDDVDMQDCAQLQAHRLVHSQIPITLEITNERYRTISWEKNLQLEMGRTKQFSQITVISHVTEIARGTKS